MIATPTLFHRDVDDFRFSKFFFYLTDMLPDDGRHACVRASHRRPPLFKRGDCWNIRRYSDAEVTTSFMSECVIEVCGPDGTGFAENTLCVHKGLTAQHDPRPQLQQHLQYALFDYGVIHVRGERAALGRIA